MRCYATYETKAETIARGEQPKAGSFARLLEVRAKNIVEMSWSVLRCEQPACPNLGGPALVDCAPAIEQLVDANEPEERFAVDQETFIAECGHKPGRTRYRNAGDLRERPGVHNGLIDARIVEGTEHTQLRRQPVAQQHLQHPLPEVGKDVRSLNNGGLVHIRPVSADVLEAVAVENDEPRVIHSPPRCSFAETRDEVS